MSFDQDLRRAFEAFADRLHDETKRHLATISDELGDAFEAELARAGAEAKTAAEQAAVTERAAAIAATEARLNEALASAQSDARAARELGRDEGRQDGERVGREQGREEGKREGAELARQEAIEAGRQKGGDEVRAQLRALELAANERLIDAVRAIDGGRTLSEILDTLVSSAGREARRVGVLLVRGGQLRAWRLIGFGSPLDERQDFEIAAAEAGLIAEAARTGMAVSADIATTASVPSFAALPPGREVLAVPVPMNGQVVAVLYADQGPRDEGENDQRVGWPSTIEVMARHAARCLEAITASRAAQVLTERPHVASAKSPAAAAAPDGGEKEDPDQAAKRYARLLVSEIKLYHEPAVLAGRRERDLMTRLAGEIARARTLYERRVPADARLTKDYFQDELVRTLADGDAALLEART